MLQPHVNFFLDLVSGLDLRLDPDSERFNMSFRETGPNLFWFPAPVVYILSHPKIIDVNREDKTFSQFCACIYR